MDYNQITIQTYNKTASEYAKNVQGLVPINELEKFVKYVPSGEILDIGCGPGVGSRFLQEKGLQVYGIDLSSELTKIAMKESPNSLFTTMDMRDLSIFKPLIFDGIWNVASLLHLEKKEIPVALNEANRVLKPEGIMYLSIKGGEGEGLEPDKRYGGKLKYYAYYKPNEIENLLKKAGFETLENYSIQYKDNYRIEHPWMNIFVRKNEKL